MFLKINFKNEVFLKFFFNKIKSRYLLKSVNKNKINRIVKPIEASSLNKISMINDNHTTMNKVSYTINK